MLELVSNSCLKLPHLLLAKLIYSVDQLKIVQPLVNFHFILNTSKCLEDVHFIQKYFDHEN